MAIKDQPEEILANLVAPGLLLGSPWNNPFQQPTKG
jgi:hypothetical protein